MGDAIAPPWNEKTVAVLNAFQRAGRLHPFTCGNADRGVLIAGPDGWRCPTCDYTQQWAHAFMAKDAAHADRIIAGEFDARYDNPDFTPLVQSDAAAIERAMEGSNDK